MVFDNSQDPSHRTGFRHHDPLPEGARETVDWYDADPARQIVDADHDALLDRLVARFG